MATVTGHSITSMDKTKRALDLHRTAFKKICSKIEDDLSTETYDLIDIQSKIKVLDDKMLHIAELNQLFFDLMLDSDDHEGDMNVELDLMDSLSSQYHKLKFRCENLVGHKEDSKKSDSKSKLKIPKLEFRQYGGDLKGWLGFLNQFSRIDEDSDLEEEDKLQYLIQTTTPGTRARQIVESYPATKGNYKKAVDRLKQRFGREDLLIEVYVRELLQLVLTNLHTKNRLSTFFDKIESQLRALESLGVKSDTCAAMLYPLVESCLGEDLIRAWHRSQFGGTQSETVKHTCYKIRLYSLTEDYSCNFEVLDQPLICSKVSSVKNGPWLDNELKHMGIKITDIRDGPIDVLVGADVAGKLYSGRKHDLECGLVAVHTLLGWTVMGKVKNFDGHTSSMIITSMFSKDVAISNLWSLDVLGIEDPKRMKTSHEQEQAVMEYFLRTVKQSDNNRYEVCMPWIEGHPPH